jgi:DNA-binding PadR family transcriptional regulator
MTSSRPLGSLQQAILLLLWNDEYYGLEIQRRLRFEGKNVGAGQLYPALRRLEEQDYISSREVARVGANRVYYTITEMGKNVVIENMMEIFYIFRHISLDYLHPYLEEAVERAEIKSGETVLDLSTPLMEKLRLKIIELLKPSGKYLLMNTNPDFSDLLSEWIKSEELESVELLDEKKVEALPDETVDIALLLFNVFELNMEWVFTQALRLLRLDGKLVVFDVMAREEDTIRDDLYKIYMPMHSKSGVTDDLDEMMTEKGMNILVYEKMRGTITGIFQKKSQAK